MEVLMLERNLRNFAGTFGTLYSPEMTTLYTLEEDWNNNKPNVSCIPAGEYPLVRTIYHKHKLETFEVIRVPGRGRILFHPGNTEEDTQGCILLGMRRGTFTVHDEDDPKHPLVKKMGVVSSRQAFGLFMQHLSKTDEAILSVKWTPATQP